MSSMRNAVQRRPHRERAQPLERRRLGLLEKHKDYSLRAKDHNKKKAQLKALRAKATERNDDEFYFGMLSRRGPGQKITSDSGRKWDGTAKGARDGNAGSMSVEAARLLKTQDLGYVRTMRQVARKEVTRLEERVVLARGFDRLDEDEDDGEEDDDEEMEGDDEFDIDFGASSSKPPKAPRKIVFLDDEDEREELLDAQDDSNNSNSRKPSGGANKETEDEAFQRAVQLRRLKKKLDNERKKLRVLAEAEDELELERARMAKTATSAGVTRRGKKLKVRTRKR
ncbi:hypothetical protein N3K66_005824 [Trichothecium roseum]|uniref:Uncharacterized protein n=1 Tax=Trichothecium roseum TaxID=47278 RepID=A0ACC0UYY3_9HYPO|nr:hypothetical protein N3K66_005824 [Trichothecium roseum]